MMTKIWTMSTARWWPGLDEEDADLVRHPDGEQDGDDDNGLAGEEVFGALADEEADIHGALDDDDVGEGEGKRKRIPTMVRTIHSGTASPTSVLRMMAMKRSTKNGARPMEVPMIEDAKAAASVAGERRGVW